MGIKYAYCYIIMRTPIFDIYCQLWCKAWSVAGCHRNILKFGFMVLYAMYSYIIYPSMVNMQHLVFELRLLQVLVSDRPCIILWQPDQNNTHF